MTTAHRTATRSLTAFGLALGVALVGTTAPVLAAAGLYETYFGPGKDGACFARTYDAAHLAAHPAQTVSHILIDFDEKNADGKLNMPERFELGLALRIKDKAEWYGNQAVCADTGSAIECFLEGDGGKFQVTPAAGGALKLETGSYGIALEGSDFVELSGTSGDDKVFLLQPSKQECADALKYFTDSSAMEGMEGGKTKPDAPASAAPPPPADKK